MSGSVCAPAQKQQRALSAFQRRVWQAVAAAGPQGCSHAEIIVATGSTVDSDGSYACSEALKALRRTDYVWFSGPRGGKGTWICTGKVPTGIEAPSWFASDGLLPRRKDGDDADPPTPAADSAAPRVLAQLPVLGGIDIDAIHRRDSVPLREPKELRDYRAEAVLILRGESVCALRSDGCLEITTDDESIELDQTVTRTLFRYLDRISAAGLAQRLETQSE